MTNKLFIKEYIVALQDVNKKLAIKWSLALFKQGKSLHNACEISGKWYEVDPKDLFTTLINPPKGDDYDNN